MQLHDDTCGAGMANANGSVTEALRPVAVATADATLAVSGQTVTLDGSGSFASNGRSLANYAWSVQSSSGAPPVITNAGTPSASFTATGNGDITLRLTVTDSRRRGGLGRRSSKRAGDLRRSVSNDGKCERGPRHTGVCCDLDEYLEHRRDLAGKRGDGRQYDGRHHFDFGSLHRAGHMPSPSTVTVTRDIGCRHHAAPIPRKSRSLRPRKPTVAAAAVVVAAVIPMPCGFWRVFCAGLPIRSDDPASGVINHGTAGVSMARRAWRNPSSSWFPSWPPHRPRKPAPSAVPRT